ncbi:MAG: hypothetical protein C0501_18100 [Isosphaera sp.]|nr:hypothetical protein [Isosphaera sp.]
MIDLTGGYTLVSGERDGHALPPDRIHHTVVRFTGDAVVVTDKDDHETYAARYTLDTSRTPWRITMTATAAPNSGAVAEGLVEKQGDTIRLVYALPGKPAPTGFETKSGELLFVMENRNK